MQTNFQWMVNHHIFLIHKIQLCWTMKKVIYFLPIKVRNNLIWFFFSTKNQSFAIINNWAAKICFSVYTKCKMSSLHWIPWNINNLSISGTWYIFFRISYGEMIWNMRKMKYAQMNYRNFETKTGFFKKFACQWPLSLWSKKGLAFQTLWSILHSVVHTFQVAYRFW